MAVRSFIVVGAGVGGLATALRLAHLGHRVTVLEKTDQVGGRNRELKVGAATFDGGPSLMMMLAPFRKLYRDVGERLEDHLDLVQCDPNYRVWFGDSTTIDATPNMARMLPQIEALAGPEEAARYPAFLGKLAELYHESMPNFVQRNYDSPLDLVRPRSAVIALRHGMLGNLAKGVSRWFRDERLRQLFCLQSMYLGLSPFDAPWVYATLAYMEYGEGIWYPRGGMVNIALSIAALAEARGAEIRLNAPVRAISGKRVELESGEVLEADGVICNADLPYAERCLLGDAPHPCPSPPEGRGVSKRRYSCSAFMMYLDYRGGTGLLHHNILLGKEFFDNLDQIFNRKEIPDDPAFYVNVTSRTDPEKAASGGENIFILVPCPNLDHPWTEADGCALQEKIFTRLEKEVGFDRDRIATMRTLTPQDWASDLNLDKGAAFGLSHDFFQSVCFRPSNRSKAHPGLYFVGASTVPGNGLPMVLIGAELVEERLRKDGLL
ncbi:phytoene desaturase family protein [soil metagenome]